MICFRFCKIVFVCILGGESWDGEEEGEIGEESVGRVAIY
jgi:hypothetical protein